MCSDGAGHAYDKVSKYFKKKITIAGLSHVFPERTKKDDRTRSGLTNPEKIIMVIWALFFTGCVLGCLVLIGLSTKRFVDKPTASTITVVSHDKTGLPFPAVTICNLNLKKNDSDFLLNTTYQAIISLYNADKSSQFTSNKKIDHLLNTCTASLSNSIQNATIWDIVSPEMAVNEFIHYCGFLHGADSDVVMCKDLFEPVLTSAGICFTFNGTNKLANSTGRRYGLKLVLNIQQEERPSFSGKLGVKLVIHDGKDIARPSLYGISVPPGFAVDVGVRKMATRDETSEAKCIDDMNLPFFPSDKFQYSQFACRENAVAENIARGSKCNCVIQPDRSPGLYASTPNCTFSKACCLLQEHYRFHPEEIDCPLPCHFEYYEHTASYSSFPNGQYLQLLMEELNMSAEYVKDNFLSIDVFFDDFQVTTTTTKYTYGIEALLGEIGGLLGLFIGVNIINFFELLVLSGDGLGMLCRRAGRSCRRALEKIKKRKNERKEEPMKMDTQPGSSRSGNGHA
ncbi:PREDICTED: acid-sensing ion channel 5-like [Amphimedon queenslandica]|uniref:Uncharacterized protein n=1 Tax=Amphimedon queenslandica TaxID=400682 RepID=A0A1X7TFB0_AMPQE|nr:PREDICTED: acid-sensing ion channel 5-like [Amphimedon queenslandica]|eukprot:XP_019859925.1 PREDICTED: acid-sensing ion channel 5-like [Amphimedon queenslandica]